DEEEDQEDEEEEDEKKKKKRLFLGHIRSKWKEQDLAEPVVLSIIRRNLLMQTPHIAASLIEELLKVVLQPEQTQTPLGDYDCGRTRMLRGSLSTGRQIQLMVIPRKRGALVKEVLGFYSTHPMGFITGPLGGHLYYSKAASGQAFKFDFSKDRRQAGALVSIKKNAQRGWEFHEMKSLSTPGRITPRSAADTESKLVSFQSAFEYAVREERLALPEWWSYYFQASMRSYESFHWTVKEGIIEAISHRELSHLEGALMEWVHNNMKEHKLGICPVSVALALKLSRVSLGKTGLSE
ncbi:hypothetical protein EK21DRAFT_95629, partial [Setomelanomma holmii]